MQDGDDVDMDGNAAEDEAMDPGSAAGAEGPDDAQPQENRPQTREELLEMKKGFKNNLHMGAHFLQDRQLQLEFRCLYLGCRFLIKEYKDAVEQLRQGQVPRLQNFRIGPAYSASSHTPGHS